nr:helix-turn-helix domain-containing protein [Mesorhizobium ephedrae]
MRVLMALEVVPDGASVASLARALSLSRTTVYRMLNTLEEHGMVARRHGDAAYCLGPTLIRLARRVPVAPDLATTLRPFVESLATRLGQTAKASVREGDEAVVIAVALGAGAFSISAQVGRRFPLHAGAASKVLLAFAPPQDVTAFLKANWCAIRRGRSPTKQRLMLGWRKCGLAAMPSIVASLSMVFRRSARRYAMQPEMWWQPSA